MTNSTWERITDRRRKRRRRRRKRRWKRRDLIGSAVGVLEEKGGLVRTSRAIDDRVARKGHGNLLSVRLDD